MWKSNIKNLNKNLIVGTIIFSIVLFIIFHTGLTNWLAEKIFLNFHENGIAKNILEKVRSKNYYSYFLLGRINFVENRLDIAIQNYSKAIGANPNFKEAYYGRGLAYGFSGPLFLDSAEKDFQKYIYLESREPSYGSWAAYNDLAWVYFLKNDLTKMEQTAKAGLQISQSNAWLSNMLGVSLLAQNKCKDGLFYIDIAEKILNQTSAEKFGEAYSGDNSKLWPIGKEKMLESIEQNLKICRSKLSTK